MFTVVVMGTRGYHVYNTSIVQSETDASSSVHSSLIQFYSGAPQETPTRQPLSPLLSFPRYVGKSTSVRGRKRLFPYEVVSTKTVSMQFYLVNKNMARTPKPGEELSLFLAGMGRRTVRLPENADHSEVTRLLTEHYPKLSSLSGGWLLYKALGGSGQRKLSVVLPGAAGYDTRYLRSVSGGGKSTIYIVPLLKELDTSPPLVEANEFLKTPKTTCHVCGLSVPLQVLAVHVRSCCTDRLSTENSVKSSAGDELLSVKSTTAADTRSASAEAPCPICHISFPLDYLQTHAGWCCDRLSTENDTTSSVKSSTDASAVGEDLPVKSTVAADTRTTSTESPSDASTVVTNSTSTSSTEAPCPICQISFPLAYLQIHASLCCDRAEEAPLSVKEDSKPIISGIKSLDDVLQTIKAAVSKDNTFEVTVSRHNMLERGLAQWQRQKKSSPVNPLRVVFLDEAGIDTGALRKEFLTGMIEGIEKRFFEGGRHGKRPKYSLCDLDKGHFKTVGEIMAASLAQGGPAPNFLASWCYKFLCSGSLDFTNLEKSDLGDDQHVNLISKVESASAFSIMDLADDIVSCGYTGAISLERKEDITRAVLLHATLKLFPILQQIRKGLQLYDLCDLISKYPEVCRPLFVPGAEMNVDADFVMSVCWAQFSHKGSYKEQREVTLMNHLQDLLQELEQNEDPAGLQETSPPLMTPRTFLQWVTGQGHVPIVAREKASFSIRVEFNHYCEVDYSDHKICYPTVAACTSTITLPVKHMLTYENFKLVMMEAFQLGQGFHKA